MAQNQLNDLMEERVYPLVTSIKGFFGSFGLSGGEQPTTTRPGPPQTGTANSQTSTPSRTRDSSSSAPPPRPPPHDAGGRSGNQANGYQSQISVSSGTATSDWTSSKNKDTWNSSRSPKSDWDSSTMSSSDQRSPFHQTLLEVGAAAGDSQSGSDASHTAAVDIEEPDYAALSTEKLGRIQFSVSYDFDEQTLTVKIIKAEGLAAKDLSGTSDPYVKISLLPDKKHTLSTNIKRKNLNPRWNEVFAFEGFPYNKVVTKTLCLVVLDYDRFSRDDPIGEVSLSLSDLDLSAGQTMWKTLAPCKGSLGKLGMLLLSLCYQPTDNTITITIIKARDLKAKDINGLSDPYVKIWMMCDGKKAEKKKTEVKEKTLNPTYNDSFTFDMPYERIRQTSLVVSVMDYDRMGRNEAIGQLILGSKSGPIEMKHWNEMFAKTRQPVTQWHILKDFD